MDITKLTSEDLQSGDLDKYDTITVGIRAYLSRDNLKKNNNRLLQYVKDGGHVVMQHLKPWDNWDTDKTAPFKLKIGRPSIEWRVTDETQTLTCLNRIVLYSTGQIK